MLLDSCKYTLKQAIPPKSKELIEGLKISVTIMLLVGGIGFIMHLFFVWLLKYL